MVQRRAAKTVDELLAHARAALPSRPSPAEALHAQANGALLIDIRGDDQRRKDGLIPGAIVLPRNSLEWRCDPESEWRHPAITRRDLRIILICDQGYQSTLAAATLQQLGLIHATDLDGGFTAWAAAGLPVIAPAPADDDCPPSPRTTSTLNNYEALRVGVARYSSRCGARWRSFMRLQALSWTEQTVRGISGSTWLARMTSCGPPKPCTVTPT
jgi:rhodanese-related sulfurtransferase